MVEDEKIEDLDKVEKIESSEGEIGTADEVGVEQEVVEVPSKKIVIGNKVITFTKRRDIDEVVGEKLGPEEIKERLITAIKKNGEEAKEQQEEKPEEIEKEPKEEKEKSKFNPKYFIPILLPVLLLGLAQSCSKNEKTPVVEYDVVPVDAIVYQVDNPYSRVEGLVNSAGQEGLTANLREKDTFEGEHYSSKEQFAAETKAVSGVVEYEDIKLEVDSNMAILKAEDSSQEQRYEAAKRLLELQQHVESVYKENVTMAREYAQRFKDASEAYRDSNTDKESIAIDIMVEEYLSELGLSSANVAQLQEIVSLMEHGYELTISDVEKELDGDYQITGNAVKKVIRDQEPGKLKTIWNKFVDFVKGRSDKEIEK